MGLANWITGTKCSECGLKIQGPKFPRTIFGNEVWVCATCEEKLKAERRTDREAAAQRRQQESEASIRGRSDADIAEVLSRSALRQYKALEKEVSDITAGEVHLNRIPAFMFVLFAESFVFQGLSKLQFDDARIERIHELFARYSLAQLVHATIRNSPSAMAPEPVDRAALLSELLSGYRRAAEVHGKNTAVLLDVVGKDPAKIVQAVIGFGVRQFFIPEEKFAELLFSDKEKFRRLLLRIVQILKHASTLQEPARLELAAIATPVNRSIAVELPESWLLRQTDPWFLYYDPCTPQYNLHITVRVVASDQTPMDVVRKTLRLNGFDTEPEMLGPIRAAATFRIAGHEKGEAKDDYHWVLVEHQATQLRYALFTLSTLAGRADSNATAELVHALHPRIQQARFLM